MNKSGAKKLWYVLALAIVLGFAALAANAGRMLVVDDPKTSDVIVVLAGETDRRPAKGVELLDEGYARRMLLNVPAASKIYEFSQIAIAEKYVNDLPEHASIDVCPIEGLSTHDEARDVAKCLQREQAQSVLIVTSDFHTRRALSVFRREIKGKSFSIAAAHDEAQFGTRWWTHRQWAKTCFEEWLRWWWWNVIDRWR